MAPVVKKNNADYCKKYRANQGEDYRKKDAARKKRERDNRKLLGPKKDYEEFKARDRARKELSKLKKLTPNYMSTPNTSKSAEPSEPSESSTSSEPSTSSASSVSAYKHRSTKSRSVNRAEKELPKSPTKRKEILSSLARKFNLEGFLPPKNAGRKIDIS